MTTRNQGRGEEIVQKHSTSSAGTATPAGLLPFLLAALLFPGFKGLTHFVGPPECLNSGRSFNHESELPFRCFPTFTRQTTLLHDLLVLGLQGFKSFFQLVKLSFLLGIDLIYLLIFILKIWQPDELVKHHTSNGVTGSRS